MKYEMQRQKYTVQKKKSGVDGTGKMPYLSK